MPLVKRAEDLARPPVRRDSQDGDGDGEGDDVGGALTALTEFAKGVLAPAVEGIAPPGQQRGTADRDFVDAGDEYNSVQEYNEANSASGSDVSTLEPVAATTSDEMDFFANWQPTGTRN